MLVRHMMFRSVSPRRFGFILFALQLIFQPFWVVDFRGEARGQTPSETTGETTGEASERAPAWSAPPLQRSLTIRDGRTNREMQWPEFVESLSAADVVFLGENHTDETTHRVQLALYEALLRQRDHQVVLALEMFDRDVQPHLDAYLAGEMEEAEFLEQSRPWGNYRTAYRPLIEQARTVQRPVVAANFPRPILRRIAFEGPEILQDLPEEEQHLVPQTLLPNSEAYWRRAENAMRGHRGMIRDSDRLHSTQSLWDNSMGESCALALDRWPGHLVLHINGDFHSAYWEGAVHQLKQRKPDASIQTVSIVPVPNPAVAEVRGAPTADFVIFVEARAVDQSEGTWSVWTTKKTDYRFHLPEHAKDVSPVPLLIVLPEVGLTSEETFELWRERLGDAAAIAVLDPPYQERQPDEGVGGRWFWNDSFSSDIGVTATALERMWGYLSRHYPIQPQRVAVLGEGTAGTVAVASTLLSDRMDLTTVAWNPRQYSHLKDLPLPLPEDWGDQTPPRRAIQVASDADPGWWEEEIAEFRAVEITAQLRQLPTSPWLREVTLENLLREALQLEPRATAQIESGDFFLLENDAPRARHWARMQAHWAEQETGRPVAIVSERPTDPNAKQRSLRIRPKGLQQPGTLPLCPGPFGGTTVIVLPEGISDQEQQSWLRLQENDPLAERSRFHRLRLAVHGGERPNGPNGQDGKNGQRGHAEEESADRENQQPGTELEAELAGLSEILERLQAENRRNVLIVPATFHADTAWLGELRQVARPFEDTMTLHWLPGLGGVRSLATSQ